MSQSYTAPTPNTCALKEIRDENLPSISDQMTYQGTVIKYILDRKTDLHID